MFQGWFLEGRLGSRRGFVQSRGRGGLRGTHAHIGSCGGSLGIRTDILLFEWSRRTLKNVAFLAMADPKLSKDGGRAGSLWRREPTWGKPARRVGCGCDRVLLDPEQWGSLRELSVQMRKSLDTPAMKQLLQSAQQARVAFAEPSLAQITEQLNQTQAAFRQMAETLRIPPVVIGLQLPTVRNWALDVEAFKAATSALRPLAPVTWDPGCLGGKSRIRADSRGAAESRRRAGVASLEPAALLAELSGRILAVVAGLLTVLDQIGVRHREFSHHCRLRLRTPVALVRSSKVQPSVSVPSISRPAVAGPTSSADIAV